MNNIETRCEILNTEIDELKAEILGEYVDNEEEDKLNKYEQMLTQVLITKTKHLN